MTGKPSPAPPRSRGRPRLVLPEADPPMAPASFTAWRERLHLNITGAARALGVSRNLVMKFESGASEVPRHIELACIAILYGLKRFNPSAPTNSPPPMPPATQEP